MKITTYSVKGPVFKLALEHGTLAEKFSVVKKPWEPLKLPREPGKKTTMAQLRKLVESGKYAWCGYSDDDYWVATSTWRKAGWLVGVDDSGSDFARLEAPHPSTLAQTRKAALANAALAGAGKGMKGVSKTAVKALVEAIRENDEEKVAKLAPVAGRGSYKEKTSSYDKEFSAVYPAHEAVKAPNPRLLELLIPHIDIRAESGYGGNLLFNAVWSGGVAQAQILLDNGLLPEASSLDGKTPLMWAAEIEDASMAALLLPLSDARAADADGDTALMRAARARLPDTIKLLLPASDVDAQNAKGETALMRAADPYSYYAHQAGMEERYDACVEMLARASSNIDAEDAAGQTALMRLVGFANRATRGDRTNFDNAVGALLASGACATRTFEDGQSLLNYAASKGLESYVDLLLEHSDPMSRGKDGDTPLIVCARAGRARLLRFFAGISDIKAANDHGATALLAALDKKGPLDKTDVLSFIYLMRDSDLNAQDRLGENALMKLIELDEPELFSLALPTTDTKLRDAKGRNALMRACSCDNPFFFERLLPVSDAAALDNEGMSALMHAAGAAPPERVAALLKAGEVDAQDHSGLTALMRAVASWHENEQSVDILLKTANARLKDHMGRTASDIASSHERGALASKIAALALAQEEREQIAQVFGRASAKAPKRARPRSI